MPRRGGTGARAGGVPARAAAGRATRGEPPAFQWLFSAHDARVHNARRFTAGETRALLAGAGFAEVRARYWNSLLFPLMVVQRKLLARGEGHRSDVAPPSSWLNRSLHAVTALERGMMAAGVPFPTGGSVLATATRP